MMFPARKKKDEKPRENACGSSLRSGPLKVDTETLPKSGQISDVMSPSNAQLLQQNYVLSQQDLVNPAHGGPNLSEITSHQTQHIGISQDQKNPSSPTTTAAEFSSRRPDGVTSTAAAAGIRNQAWGSPLDIRQIQSEKSSSSSAQIPRPQGRSPQNLLISPGKSLQLQRQKFRDSTGSTGNDASSLTNIDAHAGSMALGQGQQRPYPPAADSKDPPENSVDIANIQDSSSSSAAHRDGGKGLPERAEPSKNPGFFSQFYNPLQILLPPKNTLTFGPRQPVDATEQIRNIFAEKAGLRPQQESTSAQPPSRDLLE